MSSLLSPLETRPVRLGPGATRDPERELMPTHESAAAPVPGETLAHLLTTLIERDPERRLLHFCGEDGAMRTLRAADLGQRARAIAAGLRRAGIAPGDAVPLALNTSPELFTAFVGCLLLGAAPCITDLPFSAHAAAAWQAKLRARCTLVGARAVVADASTAALVAGSGATVLDVAELLANAPEEAALVATPESVAFMQFTSGTVSSGRAVRLSNRAVMANLRQTAEACAWSTSDLFVSWLPLYHDLGLVAHLLLPLSVGLPVALMSPMQFLLQPSRWLWALHHFRGTAVFAPNFAFEMGATKVSAGESEGLDLSSLRDAFNCAEFVHASTLRRFAARYEPHGFRYESWRPAYGMAEVVVSAACRRREGAVRVERLSSRTLTTQGRAELVPESEPDAVEIVSCGPVMPGDSVRIVGPDGADLPERAEGAIWLAGPSIFDGYHNDPEATAAVLRDGWLETGDLGYVADGELFVCGRTKDLIIKGGENYHPYAFELAASEVEGVRAGRIAALGVANQTTGTEDFWLVFETEEDDPARLREVGKRIEQELLRRFGVRPDRVVPVAPRVIPKTTSGKVRRGALAQQAESLDKLRRGAPGSSGA